MRFNEIFKLDREVPNAEWPVIDSEIPDDTNEDELCD